MFELMELTEITTKLEPRTGECANCLLYGR